MNTPILFQDDKLLVITKPILHPTAVARSLALYVAKGLIQVNTLEKDVSGTVIFAKNSTIALSPESVRKKYVFLAKGKARRKNVCTLRKAGKQFSYYELETEHDSREVLQLIKKLGLEIIHNTRQFGRLALHLESVHLGGEWITAPAPDSFTFALQERPQIEVDTAISWERRLALPEFTTDCYRLIHRGELDIPASIDIYGKDILISAFSDHDSAQDLHKKLKPCTDYLQSKTGWQGGLLRKHALNPHQKKLVADTYNFGTVIQETSIVQEHGLRYAVNINDSQHVGLFLDMRDMRKKVMEVAKDRRIANLFSFTCSFSLAAVKAGAEVVFSVDLAGSTLNRGKENFRLNNLEDCGRGKFIKEDVMKWLSRQEKKKEREGAEYTPFDLIICDPPVFASAGKGRGFHVEKQWPTLARQVRLLLGDSGIALMANNHRGGDGDFYLNELKKQFTKVEQFSPSLDFPKLPSSPDHVRIYWCEV